MRPHPKAALIEMLDARAFWIFTGRLVRPVPVPRPDRSEIADGELDVADVGKLRVVVIGYFAKDLGKNKGGS